MNAKYPQQKAYEYAQRHGYRQGAGGWIYRPDGQKVAQGWADMYRKLKLAIESEIARG